VKRLLLLVALALCPAATAAAPVPSFDHIVVVMFENKETGSILGNRAAPTFNAYARRYANLTRYYGVTHPSLPNYIALVSGSTHGITSNCTSCVVSAKSLADTIEASGRSWKAYAEGLPSPGFLGPWDGRYAKKHNPFPYFAEVAQSTDRRARIVPYSQLSRDLGAGRLPDFAFVVPDMCHSMHDCSVAVGNSWLKRAVPALLGLPKTAIFILFDEGASDAHGGGHTPALVLGTAVRPGARYTRVTSHYGALRTIEQAWGLPFLGQSARALPITGIWR
jgi:phosphatidylinositol-3-phosphatase